MKYTKRPYEVFAVPAFAIVAVVAALTRVLAGGPPRTLRIPVVVIEALPACGQGPWPMAADGAPLFCLQEGDDSSAVEVPPGCRWAILVADATGGRFLARWLHAGRWPVVRATLGDGPVSTGIVAALLPGQRALVVASGPNARRSAILSPGESWGDVIAVAGSESGGDTVIRAHNLGRIRAVAAGRLERSP